MNFGRSVDTFVHETRMALRRLSRRRGYSTFNVAVLGLGIGVFIGLSTVVTAIARDVLPFPRDQEMVWIAAVSTSGANPRVSPAWVNEWRSRSRTLASIASFSQQPLTAQTPTGPVQVVAGLIDADFFRVLAITPVAGVLPSAAQINDGRPVVLAEWAWKDWFGSAPDVVGRSIEINRLIFVVAGVAPTLSFPSAEIGVWLPAAPFFTRLLPTERHVRAIARRRPTASMEAVNAELAPLVSGIAREGAEQVRPHAEPLRDYVAGELRRGLFALLMAAGMMMLLAFVNSAMLMLGDLLSREREIAVRQAIGAPRGLLVASSVIEGAVLGIGAALGGILLAVWGLELLGRQTAVLLSPSVSLDLSAGRVLAAVGLGLLPGVTFGAITLSRVRMARWFAGLREGVGQTSSPIRVRLRDSVLAFQLCITVTLIAGTGLMSITVYRLVESGPGFDGNGVATARLQLPFVVTTPSEAGHIRSFVRRLVQEAERDSRFTAVAIASEMPSLGAAFPVHVGTQAEGRMINAGSHSVTPGFFKILGLPLRAGRDFTSEDDESRGFVAIIDERVARLLFGAGQPIGQPIRIRDFAITAEVIGVAPYTRETALGWDTPPGIYLPLAQVPLARTTLLARVAGGVAPATAVMGLIRAADPGQSVGPIQMLDEVLARGRARPMAVFTMLFGFAAVATLLTVVGLYGITRLVAGQRHRELAIRSALGAPSSALVTTVARRLLLLSGAGIVLGMGTGLLLCRALAPYALDGLTSSVPVVATSAALAALISLLAIIPPAVHAARGSSAARLQAE